MRRRKLKAHFKIDVQPFLSIWLACLLLLGPLYIVLIVMRINISGSGRPVVKLYYMPLPGKIKLVHPKTPTYFDCSAGGITIHPGNIRVNWDNLWQEPQSNVVEQLLNKIQANNSKEYVIQWRLTRAWKLSNWVEFPNESASQRQNEFKDLAVLTLL